MYLYMRASTKKRLRRVANDIDTMRRIHSVAEGLFESHARMDEALKAGNIDMLSKAIRDSKEQVKRLRFVLKGTA